MTDATWQDTVHADLERVRTGLLDLVDVGPAPQPGPLRRPTDAEKDATANETTIPHAPTRTSDVPDPTAAAAARTEAAVAHALTQLEALTDMYATEVASIGDDSRYGWHKVTCPVTDEHGALYPRPALLPTRTTTSGRTVVAAGLTVARRATLDRTWWCAAAATAIAEIGRAHV